MRTKKQLIVFNIGSFCDGSLMDEIVDQLRHVYKIFYIMDQASHTNKSHVKPVEIFHTPEFLISDPLKHSGDPNTPILFSILSNPIYFTKTILWLQNLERLILGWEEKIKPDAMIVHYNLIFVLLFIENKLPGFLQRIPRFVCYFAPNILNKTIPWLFDSRLRDPQFRLYKTPKKTVLDSWKTILSRMDYKHFTFLRSTDVSFEKNRELLNKLHHLICWDKHHVKQLDYMIPSENISFIGGFYPSMSPKPSKKSKLPSSLHTFLEKNDKKTVFVSFGSISTFPLLNKAFNDIAISAVNNGFKVIIHKTFSDAKSLLEETVYNNPDIMVYEGFVAYHDIIREIDIVVFTGSLCLQLISFAFQKAMIYFPLTDEQYFWAKNFTYFTGVPYIDMYIMYHKSIREQTDASLKSVRQNSKLQKYLKTMYQDMKTRDPHLLQKTIEKKISKHDK